MKAISIEFVLSRAWRWVWGIAMVLLLGVLAIAGWKWYHIAQVSKSTRQALVEARAQLQKLSQREAPAADPRATSLQQASDLLQRNLNAAFTAAENMKEPGTKLKSLSYDAMANTLRLDYELDSVARSSSVTAVLNSGYETQPWSLDTVTAISGNQTGISASTTGARASWTGRIATF